MKNIIQKSSNLPVISFDLTNNLNTDTEIVLGRHVPKLFANELETKKIMMVFVGSKDSKLLPIWLMTFPQLSNYVHYTPGNDKILDEK